MECKNLKVTSIVNNGSTLNLTVTPNLSKLCNGQLFRLIICTDIPVLTSVLPVYVVLGNSAYPILDCIGNTFYSDQLKSRTAYPLVFGTSAPHFKLRQCSERSSATPQEVAV